MAPESNSQNPSDAVPEPPAAGALDVKKRDGRDLPHAFESIRDQLEPEAIAKLRAIDKSRAMVTLRIRGGSGNAARVSQPLPLAGFVLDFAIEAADEMGTGGPMLAVINPNDGVLENFAFGFIASGEIRRDAGQSSEVAMLRDELRRITERLERQQQLMLLSGGGGGMSRKEFLEEMKLTRDLFKDDRPVPPAPDPNAQISAMGQMFSGMCTAMGQGMKSIREVGGELASAAPERSFAQEFKEVMSIEGAPQLAHKVVDRVLPDRRPNSVAGNQGGNAGGEQKPTARANPLERHAG